MICLEGVGTGFYGIWIRIIPNGIRLQGGIGNAL
jgi:hypothetical protein